MDSSDGLEAECHLPPSTKRRRVPKCTFCRIKGSTSRSKESIIVGTEHGISVVLQVCNDGLGKNEHDAFYLEVKNIISNPKVPEVEIYWHSTCYKSFTKQVNAKSNCANKSVPKDDFGRKKNISDGPSTRSSAVSFDWESMCVFSNIACNVSRKRDPMSKVTSQSVLKNISTSAERRGDWVLIRRLSNVDLVAVGAQYHRKCYQAYISERNIKANSTEKQNSSQQSTLDPYQEAFDRLVAKINEPLLHEGAVFELPKLLHKYKQYLHSVGVNSPGYPSHRLKDRLLNHYGDRVIFKIQTSSSHGAILMANAAVDSVISNVVSQPQNCEENECEAVSENVKIRALFEAAAILRADIKGTPDIELWSSSDISKDNATKVVPKSLYQFLVWLLSGAENPFDSYSLDADLHNAEYHDRILSIGQDLFWCLSGGRKYTPKHIGLAMTIRHITGSQDVISIVNKFGHCCSPKTLARFETNIAEQHMESQADDEAIIPSNIFAGSFIQAAADNNDFQEETLDGKLTTHATTMVLYQRSVKEPVPVLTSTGKFGALPKRPRNSTMETPPSQIQIIKAYNAGNKRSHPASLKGKVNIDWFLKPDRTSSNVARLLDQAWILCRMCPTKLFTVTLDNANQCIPGWSAFNEKSTGNCPELSVVGFCPMLPAPATDLSTIYTVMDMVSNMMYKLGQLNTVLTFDQALYCKAKEIQWHLPDHFKHMVIRLGGFHVAMVFLTVLGKRFKDTGLEDALTDSGIYAGNTVDQIFRGSHYNRGIRCHKLVMEAMCRLRWLAVIELYYQDLLSDGISEQQMESSVADVLESFRNGENIHEAVHQLAEKSSSVLELLEWFSDFNSDMANVKFWNSYIDMMSVLLQYIRAERDGLWTLHLSSLADMIPYFFEYDHQNYARWVPVYLSDMHRLPETAPSVHQQFMLGNFPVKGSSGRFNQVWTDLKLEQSINRHSKTAGGLVGISRNQNAVDRWHITLSDRIKMTESTRQMCGSTHSGPYVHKEAGRARVSRDENDIQKLINFILSFGNPFQQQNKNILNIITGVVASDDISTSLLSAKSHGEQLMKEFVVSRLDTDAIGFFQPISKVKSKTFSLLNKKSFVKLKDKNVALSAERNLFGRLVVISQKRNISVSDLFQYELSAVPWSLAKSDGSLAKCQKSLMLDELGKCLTTEDLEMGTASRTCSIVDGMAVIQMHRYTGLQSFGQYAQLIIRCFLKYFETSSCSRVDIVFDQYANAKQSIKAGERSNRGSDRGVRQNILSEQTPISLRWDKFIAEPENKSSLTNFLTRYCMENVQALLSESQTLVVAGGLTDGRVVVLLTKDRCVEVNSMSCSHEEADTRMIFHASMAAASGFQRIIVHSPDTDVLVLLVHFSTDIGSEVWLHMSKGGRRFPTHIIARKLGLNMCKCLLAFHAITGCDTTSCLVKQGKVKPWELLKSNSHKFPAVAELSTRPLDEIKDNLEQFVSSIYNGSPTTLTCNQLRYKLFAKKGSQNELLPPTTNALLQHLNRAEYQTLIWLSSLQPNPEIPDPVGRGWTKGNDGSLCPVLMTMDPMPKAIAEMVKCGCKSSKCASRCSCKAAELPCTEACLCEGDDNCHNIYKNDDVGSNELSSEDDSDSED